MAIELFFYHSISCVWLPLHHCRINQINDNITLIILSPKFFEHLFLPYFVTYVHERVKACMQNKSKRIGKKFTIAIKATTILHCRWICVCACVFWMVSRNKFDHIHFYWYNNDKFSFIFIHVVYASTYEWVCVCVSVIFWLSFDLVWKYIFIFIS